MRLFIRIKNGEPFEHPILENNFKAAYPEVDVSNLPAEFARFERVEPPIAGPYEVYEGVSYEPFSGVYRDVHHVRPMTGEEKISKQNTVKTDWAKNNGYASWVFNEDTCLFDPPVDHPDNGVYYVWNESTVSWEEPEEE